MTTNGTETAGGGLSTSAHTEVEREDVSATSLGISIAQNVRRYVSSLPIGAELSVPSVYEWFLVQLPETRDITIPASFKVGISSQLNQLCGKKLIHLYERGSGGRPNLFRKGKQVSIATMEKTEEELIALERTQQATRAAAVELAYLETWG